MASISNDDQWAFHRLVSTLRLAALPAHEQVAALPDFVHVPDEIALEYDSAFQMVPRLVEAGVITVAHLEPLHALDQLFAEMTDVRDRESVWTLSAMERDECWARTRMLALAALAAIGATPGPPDIDGASWVPSS